MNEGTWKLLKTKAAQNKIGKRNVCVFYLGAQVQKLWVFKLTLFHLNYIRHRCFGNKYTVKFFIALNFMICSSGSQRPTV